METKSGTILPVLSYVLNQMVATNDKLPLETQKVTLFHATTPPAISIKDYLERIMKYVPSSYECFIVGLIYIDRVIQHNENFLITSLNVHRLLLTGVMLAGKFFSDEYYSNGYYARLGGIPQKHINGLELEFLFLIKFELNVDLDLFEKYRAELLRHVPEVNGGNMPRPVFASQQEYQVIHRQQQQQQQQHHYAQQMYNQQQLPYIQYPQAPQLQYYPQQHQQHNHYPYQQQMHPKQMPYPYYCGYMPGAVVMPVSCGYSSQVANGHGYPYYPPEPELRRAHGGDFVHRAETPERLVFQPQELYHHTRTK